MLFWSGIGAGKHSTAWAVGQVSSRAGLGPNYLLQSGFWLSKRWSLLSPPFPWRAVLASESNCQWATSNCLSDITRTISWLDLCFRSKASGSSTVARLTTSFWRRRCLFELIGRNVLLVHDPSRSIYHAVYLFSLVRAISKSGVRGNCCCFQF